MYSMHLPRERYILNSSAASGWHYYSCNQASFRISGDQVPGVKEGGDDPSPSRAFAAVDLGGSGGASAGIDLSGRQTRR